MPDVTDRASLENTIRVLIEQAEYEEEMAAGAMLRLRASLALFEKAWRTKTPGLPETILCDAYVAQDRFMSALQNRVTAHRLGMQAGSEPKWKRQAARHRLDLRIACGAERRALRALKARR